jgi:hypothetical protein
MAFDLDRRRELIRRPRLHHRLERRRGAFQLQRCRGRRIRRRHPDSQARITFSCEAGAS